MKKTVFANWGTAGQGKSSTVKEIAQLILKNYPSATTDPVTIDFTFDIRVVITIGKIKIGIESQGDPNSRLFDSLKYFVKINCDIIICSTRTSGSTVDAVNELYSKHGYDNVWVTNYRSNEKNQNTLNDFSAKHIFELIQQSITGKI
jgi:hypothetical protein